MWIRCIMHVILSLLVIIGKAGSKPMQEIRDGMFTGTWYRVGDAMFRDVDHQMVIYCTGTDGKEKTFASPPFRPMEVMGYTVSIDVRALGTISHCEITEPRPIGQQQAQ